MSNEQPGNEAPDSVQPEAPSRPNRLRRALVRLGFGLVLAAILAVLLFGLPSRSKAGPDSVPAFSLQPLLQPGISGPGPWPKVVYPLTGSGAHKPVVITFFASWCAPCQEELPMVAKVTAQLMSQGTQVQFIGVDGGDDQSPGWSFVSSSGIKFPVAFDPNETFANSLELEGPPTTIFVYRTGKIAEIVRGPVTEAQLRQWIKTISNTG